MDLMKKHLAETGGKVSTPYKFIYYLLQCSVTEYLCSATSETCQCSMWTLSRRARFNGCYAFLLNITFSLKLNFFQINVNSGGLGKLGSRKYLKDAILNNLIICLFCDLSDFELARQMDMIINDV